VHLRVPRLHFVSKIGIVLDGLSGDISEEDISIIPSITEVGNIGGSGMVIISFVLPLE
jgi:hypothetical protein